MQDVFKCEIGQARFDEGLAELPENTTNHQLCIVIPRNSGMI